MNELNEIENELERAADILNQLSEEKNAESERIEEQKRYIEELQQDLKAEEEEGSNATDIEELDALAANSGLAVVIGHCSFKEGACAVPPLDKCEFAYNKLVAEKIKATCDAEDIRCKIFTREWGSSCLINRTYIRRVKPWKPQCTVELHFNSGTPDDPYTVTLYARDDSKNWTLTLQNNIRKVYDRPADQADKIWKRVAGQAGYSSTKHLPNSALIEPFFGSVTSDSTMGKERVDELAKAVVDAFLEFQQSPTFIS